MNKEIKQRFSELESKIKELSGKLENAMDTIRFIGGLHENEVCVAFKSVSYILDGEVKMACISRFSEEIFVSFEKNTNSDCVIVSMTGFERKKYYLLNKKKAELTDITNIYKTEKAEEK